MGTEEEQRGGVKRRREVADEIYEENQVGGRKGEGGILEGWS